MAKVVICPSCQYQGSIPDEVQAKRIRCPKCKEIVRRRGGDSVGCSGTGQAARAGEAAGSRGRARRLTISTASSRCRSVSNSGTRRALRPVPAAAPVQASRRWSMPRSESAGLPWCCSCVVLVVVLTRGGGEPPAKVGGRPIVPAAPTTPARARPRRDRTGGRRDAPKSSAITPTAADGNRRRRRPTAPAVHRRPGDRPPPEGGDGLSEEQGRRQDARVRYGLCDRSAGRHRHAGDQSARRGARPLRSARRGSIPKGSTSRHRGGLPQWSGAAERAVTSRPDHRRRHIRDFSTDLAFLVVKGVKRPPKPLNVFAKSDTTEGMAYTGGGFSAGRHARQDHREQGESFGHDHRRADRGPASRRSRADRLVPGRRLAPAGQQRRPDRRGKDRQVRRRGRGQGGGRRHDRVRRSGRAKCAGHSVAAWARSMGRVSKARREPPTWRSRPRSSIPRGWSRAVVVHVAPASAGTISPNSDGSWPPFPNTKGVELKRDPKTQYASGRVQVALSGRGPTPARS